jgi:membrane protease subunit HflK
MSMAWNEPGGGRDNDPWKKGGGDGPPDLEEALKKLQERLNSIFGGGNKGRSNNGDPFVVSGSLIIAGVVLAVIGWALLGLYSVDEKERAVVLRLGKYLDTNSAGLHWNPPLIDKVTKVRVTEERQYAARGLMLTKDENIVELPLTVQYNIANAKNFVLNVRDPEISLQHATDSALRHAVGSSKLDDVMSSGRQQLGDEVAQRLQRYLDSYGSGIKVVKINIQEARPPTEVKSAYDDVIRAREDYERAINEAQAYSNGVIPESRGKAQRIVEEAMGYRNQVLAKAEGEASRFDQLLKEYQKAPEVTRERLYIDAVQNVYENTNKVMVDTKSSGNMLYVPLDKMMDGAARKASVDTANPARTNEIDIRQLTDRVIEQLRSDTEQRRSTGAVR